MDGPGDDRRHFLKRVVLATSGVLSSALAATAGGYLFAGAGRKQGARWTTVARLDDIEPDRPLHAEYLQVVPDAWATIRRRQSVWLVRGPEPEIIAFDPHCTHLGCPYDWDSDERVFKCPCHDGVFDIEGRVLAGPPPRPLDRLEVRIEDDWLLVGSLRRTGSA